MKTIAITIDHDLLEAVDRYRGQRGGVSRSACVREALSEYLTRAKRRQAEARDAQAYARLDPRLHRQLKALIEDQATL
jgi:metal-responsive CopG/Arc/MetJ family transcriptional regulator